VGWTYDVNQRFAEIDILGSSITDIADTIRFFYDKVSVLDDEGHSLFFDPFDTHQLYGFNNA
jgi:hypothetical protein